MKFYRPSPKSLILFTRIGKRRFDLEINWLLKYITLSTGLKGQYSKKIF